MSVSMHFIQCLYKQPSLQNSAVTDTSQILLYNKVLQLILSILRWAIDDLSDIAGQQLSPLARAYGEFFATPIYSVTHSFLDLKARMRFQKDQSCCSVISLHSNKGMYLCFY